MLQVWTDGSRTGKGHGGWAWVNEVGDYDYGYEADTTNQRMEMRAVIEAIREHDEDITVISDSAYVINCMHEAWWQRWLSNGWRTAGGKAVSNRDLWEALLELRRDHLLTGARLLFVKVKGHSGDPGNDAADRWATHAARTGAAPVLL